MIVVRMIQPSTHFAYDDLSGIRVGKPGPDRLIYEEYIRVRIPRIWVVCCAIPGFNRAWP